MERKEDIGRMHTAGITIDFEYAELWRGLHRSNPLSFKKPYSFTVYKDRDKYMAEDWRGRVRYEDDDASEVMQSAVDNGGLIFIRSGVYDVSSKTITIEKPIVLIGEVLIPFGASGGVVLKTTDTTKTLLEIKAQCVVIRNILFEGPGESKGDPSGIGIYMDTAHHSTLENIRVWKFTGAQGIKIDGGGESITLRKVHIRNCDIGLEIYDEKGDGITELPYLESVKLGPYNREGGRIWWVQGFVIKNLNVYNNYERGLWLCGH